MTNTIDALDQFTQALGPMLPSPPAPGLPGERGPALPRSGAAALPGLAPLCAPPLAAGSGHWLGAAAPGPFLPSTYSQAVDTRRCGALAADDAPHLYPVAVTAAGAEKNQPAAGKNKGITRKGPRGDWPRRAGLAVLALTIGLGLTHVVRATQRAGESYWHQEIGKSLASRQHGYPAPFALHALPFLSSTALGNHLHVCMAILTEP